MVPFLFATAVPSLTGDLFWSVRPQMASDHGRRPQSVGMGLPQRGSAAPPARLRGGCGCSILCSSIKSLVEKDDQG
ncbi:unnamed protein product [Urochloa humidicola]